MKKFYDTSALLSETKLENLFKEEFLISSVTLSELENIKTNKNKDTEIKQIANKLTKLLVNNLDKFRIVIYTEVMKIPFDNIEIPINNDIKILACALYQYAQENQDIEFVTNDLNLAAIACIFFPKDRIKMEIKEDKEEIYTGYKILQAESDEALAEIYNNIYSNNNVFDLIENEYLIIKDNNKVIDKYKFNNNTFERLKYISFNSKQFGTMKPLDATQSCYFDSLVNNDLTLIQGKPGSGKSCIALAYIFDMLERGEYERVYMFANPVPVAGAQQLGFYPGDPNEKLLSTGIGNILSTHLGDFAGVERLLEERKLIFIPMVDARGVDIPEDSIVYMTESQNMSISLMKLLLQRVGKKVKVIIDGDFSNEGNQIDASIYKEKNNGMRRLIDVFKGHKMFGMSTLDTVHRSEIADLAEKM